VFLKLKENLFYLKKNKLCYFIFFLHYGHTEIQTKPTSLSA
jgi:hypothetical protein